MRYVHLNLSCLTHDKNEKHLDNCISNFHEYRATFHLHRRAYGINGNWCVVQLWSALLNVVWSGPEAWSQTKCESWKLCLFCSLMCYALTSPIGGAIYKKQMRLLWSEALKQQEELIKLPVCLCQLQEVNFIRGTGQNHICTCILRAVPEPEAE